MHPIGEAARLSGVTVETSRYYERAGVMPPAPRAANGRRLYGREDIVRLRFVARCRALGFPLRGAVAMLGLAATADTSCATVEAIGEHHLADVRAKLADLRAMEAGLVALVRQCDEGRATCPALAELFR